MMNLNYHTILDKTSKKGQFLKGSIPHNKGKKWSEWIDGRKKRKMLKNLEKGRVGNPNLAGSNKKAIVAISKGKFYPFHSSADAERITKICSRNIRKCCNGERKTAGGFQWFFDKDIEKWKNLISI